MKVVVTPPAFYKSESLKSKLSSLFPNTCRFLPTCSTYAKESFEQHGFIKGIRLTVARLLRCRPGGGSGYDPVPDA